MENSSDVALILHSKSSTSADLDFSRATTSTMKRLFINILLALIQITVTLAAKKNLIIDTDLFSDVE